MERDRNQGWQWHHNPPFQHGPQSFRRFNPAPLHMHNIHYPPPPIPAGSAPPPIPMISNPATAPISRTAIYSPLRVSPNEFYGTYSRNPPPPSIPWRQLPQSYRSWNHQNSVYNHKKFVSAPIFQNEIGFAQQQYRPHQHQPLHSHHRKFHKYDEVLDARVTNTSANQHWTIFLRNLAPNTSEEMLWDEYRNITKSCKGIKKSLKQIKMMDHPDFGR